MTLTQKSRDRLRAGVFYGMMLVLVFVAVDNRIQSKRNGRLSEQVLAQGRKIEALSRAIDAQSKTNGGISSTVLANQAAITQAIEQVKSAVTAAKAAAEAVPNCFKPEGDCTKSAAANQTFVRNQLSATLAAIKALEFRVTGTVGQPGQPGVPFVGKASTMPPCQPVVGVGNVGVLPGVVCASP